MFKINLVPEVQEKKLDIERFNFTTNVVVGAVLAVLVAAILIINGIQLVKSSTLNATNAQIRELNDEIATYKELEETVFSLENGLAGVKAVNDGANRWTALMPHLEKATPGSVKFQSLKLSAGAIEAKIEAASVDSLAKMLESLKEYKVIVLSGSGTEGDTVEISIDGGAPETARVKSNGRWLLATSFDPSVDHEVKVTPKSGQGQQTIEYVAKDKTVSANDQSITAVVKSLFTTVSADQYKRTPSGTIESTIKMAFDPGVIW